MGNLPNTENISKINIVVEPCLPRTGPRDHRHVLLVTLFLYMVVRWASLEKL